MEPVLEWPERPICHDNDWQANRFLGVPVGTPPVVYTEHSWRPAQRERPPYGESFRRCSYCGSIHPEDFYDALLAGATLDRADMKYGWPHKFYVDGIPNLLAGQTVQMGGRSYWRDGQLVEEPYMSAAPATVMVKWYNEHLADLNQPAFEALTRLILEKSGVSFIVTDGKLQWRMERQHG